MSAVSDVRMSQQDLRMGLQVFHKPKRKATYLACALLNDKAKVEDVVAVALETITKVSYCSSIEFSLVLPTLFQLKKIAKSYQKEVIQRFSDEVNKKLDSAHPRRLVSSKEIKNLSGLQPLDFLSDGVSSRNRQAEKVYFLANALIANLKVNWKSTWKSCRDLELHWYSDDFQSWLMTNVSSKEGLSFLLGSFLKEVTGKDRAIFGDYQAALEKEREARVTSISQQLPETAATDNSCVIA